MAFQTIEPAVQFLRLAGQLRTTVVGVIASRPRGESSKKRWPSETGRYWERLLSG
jgi:hypothetical protein